MQMNSLRRKLAIATWVAPREGNIYGKLTVDVTQALEYLEYKTKKTGQKITITHLVGKAVAMSLTKAPGLNGRIRFGTFIPHPWVNITYLVALEEGKDLAKATVKDTDKKSLEDISAELKALAIKLHKGEDEAFNKNKGLIKMMPSFVLKHLLRIVGFLTSILGINSKALGLEAYPFGSAIITNVGVFGLDEGFAPPTPFAHVPVLVLMGAIKDTPLAIDGEVVIRKTLTLTATIDHRFMDGAQGGLLAKVTRNILENPWQLDDLEGPPEDAIEVVEEEAAKEIA